MIRKAKAKHPPTRRSGSAARSPTTIAQLQELCISQPLTHCYHLTPTLNERAIGFFFSNYVVDPDLLLRDYLDHLAGVRDHGIEENLFTGIKAVGLAGLSNVSRDHGLLVEARKQYLAAIRLVNSALQSPIDSVKDSTLLVIMILSIFEALTGSNKQSLTTWVNHINGASALLKQRGSNQLATPKRRQMFLQIAFSLVTSCIQQQVPLPPHILQLSSEARIYADDSDDKAWGVLEIMVLFTEFHASIRGGTVSESQDILDRALGLDRMFEDALTDLPPGWGYKTVTADINDEHVFADYYHVYENGWVGQLCNGMRALRIMLNDTIRDVLLAGFSSKPPLFLTAEYTTQFQRSVETLYRLQSEIFASVPQHLEYSSKAYPSSSTATYAGSPFSSDSSYTDVADGSPSETLVSVSSWQPLIRTSSSYFPLWPLLVAGGMDITTNAARDWATQTLRHIGQSRGVHQAYALADMLDKKENLIVWHRQQRS